MVTAIYAIMHLLVDGVCALAMFGSFLSQENGYLYILVYNFCAFALQMPIGALLDILAEHFSGRRFLWAFFAVAAGVLCTIAGAVTHPALLGIGNALFHAGGGVGCICQDNGKNWIGRGLGVFVAPGALGLYLGTLLSQQGGWKVWYAGVSAGMVLLCIGAGYCLRGSGSGRNEDKDDFVVYNQIERSAMSHNRTAGNESARNAGDYKEIARLLICCFLVVVLRSYIGMAVTFPWKTDAAAGCLAVLALVSGKAAGGFGAARFGARKAAACSLGLAALCYLFASIMPVGLAAVFLFNMTMPITLYWMVCSMPRMPGFAFGCLTFALFLGFLPGYFGLLPQTGGNVLGCVGCILSLLLLLLGIGRKKS